jgi:hypothetical protein
MLEKKPEAADRLLSAVAGERRLLEVLRNGIRKRRAVDSNRGSEDQTRVVTVGGVRRPNGFEQCPGAVEVYLVTLLEVRLSLT